MSVADDIEAVADGLEATYCWATGRRTGVTGDLPLKPIPALRISADRLRRIAAAVRGEGAPTRKGGDGTAAPSSPSPPPTGGAK